MKIIIIGGGKVGLRLAQDLVLEGHDVVVIDQEEKVISGMLESIDVRGVIGSGVDLDILKEAGVQFIWKRRRQFLECARDAFLEFFREFS